MEETLGLCVDPEEDEIFFYEINEKDVALGVVAGDKLVESGPENQLVKNNSSENDRLFIESVNPKNDVEKTIKVEHAAYLKLPVDVSNAAEKNLNMCENIAAGPDTVGDKIYKKEADTSNENRKKEVESKLIPILKGNKSEFTNEFNQNNRNIHDDHNYSTLVKTVIDKSILKTPKSIVKADKDGGFLKVLSEIALVKAEVDENTINDASLFPNSSPKKEIINVDNKENEKCVRQNNVILVEPKQGLDFKLDESIENRLKVGNQNEKFLAKPEINNISCVNDMEKVKGSEINNTEQSIEKVNGKEVSNCNTNTIAEAKDCFGPCKKDMDGSNDGLEVIYQKLATDMNKMKKEEEREKLINITDLLKQDNSLRMSPRESNERPCEHHGDEKKKEFKIKIIPQINIMDETLPVEKDDADDECIFLDERHKKYLRRKTMNLLQELSEIVSHEQDKRKSEDMWNSGLSEEAAKVIQKLKAVAIDDSTLSHDQYFDLDNLNESFLDMEKSEILGETLSKPLDLLTNKDVELLLEKINSNSLEHKFQLEAEMTEISDAEKENNYQNMENLKRNLDQPDKPPINKFGSSGKFQKTPVSVKNNMETLDKQHNKKIIPVSKCLFEKGIVNQKPLTQSQTNHNMIRVQSADKGVKANGDTKIPKLTSTASKIPIKGSRDRLMQNRIPALSKTPYHKATRSLKFNHIKSPVQAYINAKTPVLISNVKGNNESEFTVWMKAASSENKIAKPLTVTKNISKSNLPSVNYRSAIPLKLEKSSESRLPRLAPKMQKLILGNSPVIDRHEGRIQLATTNRPQISMNESSIMINPNEVSVIVRKVALNSNIKK